MPISGRVIGLRLLIEHQQRPEPVRRARALVDLGLEGDVHGKKKAGSHRQVLIVDRATLEALSLQPRSEEHTSELQSRLHLVCRLLLEKKKEVYREIRRRVVVNHALLP